MGGAETVVYAMWWVTAEAGVDAVVGECGGRGGRARANAYKVWMQLHANQFHAATGARLERWEGDVRVVASCVRLLRNMSRRDVAMRAGCGEMWRVTRVVGGGGGAGGRTPAWRTDAGVAEMFCRLLGGVCLRGGDVADGCARNRAVEVVVRAVARRAAA